MGPVVCPDRCSFSFFPERLWPLTNMGPLVFVGFNIRPRVSLRPPPGQILSMRCPQNLRFEKLAVIHGTNSLAIVVVWIYSATPYATVMASLYVHFQPGHASDALTRRQAGLHPWTTQQFLNTDVRNTFRCISCAFAPVVRART